jgi:hypothetical protein
MVKMKHDRQYNGQNEKGQTHIQWYVLRLKIEQHEPHLKPGM